MKNGQKKTFFLQSQEEALAYLKREIEEVR